jgi:hypothetical protein
MDFQPEKKTNLTAILIAIIIALVVLVAFFVGMQLNKNTLNQSFNTPAATTPNLPSTTPVVSATPTPTVTVTAKPKTEPVKIPDIKVTISGGIVNDKPSGEIQKFRIYNNGQKIGVITPAKDQGADDRNLYDYTIFKQFNNEVYIGFVPYGIGGYMLYFGPSYLYRIDLSTKKIKNVLNGGFVTDVSADGKLIYVIHRSGQEFIVLKNLQTGFVKKFAVASKYKQAGDALFSPNGKKIAYAAALGNPEKEAGKIFIVDIATGDKKIVATINKGAYQILGWKYNGSDAEALMYSE